MRYTIFISLSILALFCTHCTKDPVVPTNNVKDLSVPTDFEWANHRSGTLAIQVINPSNFTIENRVIQLLDQESRIISQGVIQGGKAQIHADVLSTASALSLFFPMTRARMSIPNIKNIQSVNFDITPPTEAIPLKTGGSSPSCDQGCTQVFSGNLSTLEIKSEGTFCLTGTLTGGLSITKNATLRICGTANISWVNISSNRQVNIIVTSTGTLNSSGFYLESNNHTLENYGTVNLNNWYNIKTTLRNYGNMTVKGMEVKSTGILQNYHTFTSNGEVNIYGQVLNESTFTISGNSYNLNIESSGVLNNQCKFTVPRNLNTVGRIVNSGYLRVAGTVYAESQGTIELGNLGMLHCHTFQPNCQISCTDPNGYGSIKVDAVTNLDSKTQFTGSIDLCDANGIDNNWGATVGSNVTNCAVYIPVNGCNPEGIGSPPVQDADKDGIVDDEDQFPEDPARAFLLNEPYVGYKLWAFEDLWPSTGDYDFNDLVLSTRIQYTLGPDMKPVSANAEVLVKALGAGLNNGIALHFLNSDNLAGSIIKTVSGSSVVTDPAEPGCIIISNDIKQALKPFYNNNGVGPRGTPQAYRFDISFDPGRVAANMNLSGDFFLFRTSNRSHEIHVAGNPASPAADLNLFGTSEDGSNPDRNYWYKTTNGIPWGLTLILTDEEWNHPVEKKSILEAYPDFRDWAISGGKNNTNWHQKGVYENCFHF